jgi:hypothetical protein
MKTLKKLLFFIAGICLLTGCSKSDQFLGYDNNPKNDQNGQALKNWCIPGTVYKLSGFALYDTWEVISGKVWQHVANPSVGTLEFLEDGNFIFSFNELREGGNMAVFQGKITNSGTLTFKFPTPLFPGGPNITDVIALHACAEIWGEGVNENTLVCYGKFKGNEFEATAKFNARVHSPCPANDMFDPSLVNGDLWWTFGYDFKVVK